MDPGRHSGRTQPNTWSPATQHPSPSGCPSTPPAQPGSEGTPPQGTQGPCSPRTTLSALGQREHGCVRYTWSMIFSLTWEMVSQLRTLTGTASAPSSWTITLTVCRRTQGEEPAWGPRSHCPPIREQPRAPTATPPGGAVGVALSPQSTRGGLAWPCPKPGLNRTDERVAQGTAEPWAS